MALDEYGQPESPTDISVTGNYFGAPDYHLQVLATSSNRSDNGFVVTLVVSGGLISGVLTTHRRFLTESAKAIRELGDESGDEKVIQYANETAQDFFDDVAKRLDDELNAEFETIKNGGEPNEDPVSRALMSRHINLSHALYHQPGATPIQLGHTRVLASQVAAWSVGRPQ